MRVRRAFTLAEAIVTAAIVAILAAILWPVQRSHCYGNRESCERNLKQILLGFKQYAQDYDEVLPLLNAAQLPPTKPASSGFVCSLQPYLHNFEIFQCPSEASHHPGNTDYAYNSGPLAGLALGKIRNGADTVMLCDAFETPGLMASASAPKIIDRHWEGADYAFVDGHVKWLRSDKAPSPSSVRATSTNFTFGR